MAAADTLPDTIRAVARSLGILDAAGDLDPRFFEAPLKAVGAALVEPERRRALLDALPTLVGDGDVEPHGAGERRRYPLVEEDAGELALALDLDGAAASVDVTILLTIRATLDEAGAGALRADLDVPLVRASGSTLRAVCGVPSDGPIALRIGYTLTSGVTLEARASADTAGGSLAVRVSGVVIDGTPIPPLEVRSDALGDD